MATQAPTLTTARYLIGAAAVAALGYGLWPGTGPGAVMVPASVFLCLITFTDTLSNRIPNLVTLPLLAGAVVGHLYLAGPAGLQFALLGGLTGFALLLGPYLLLGMGGGDLKAMTALGALLGPWAVFQVFLFTGLIGGLLALLYLALAGRLGEKAGAALRALQVAVYLKTRPATALVDGPATRIRFPYAPAITFGYVAFIHWGGLI